MRTRRLVPGILLAAVVLALAGGPAVAQQRPGAVTLGTNPPGTVIYAAGSGIAKVVSGAAPFQMVVQPYTGATTYFPVINSGELDFALASDIDLAMSYQGPGRLKLAGRNPYPHTPHIRLVMRGAPLPAALLVRRDSPIKTIAEVKGKRVTGEFPAQLNNFFIVYANLASAGLTWDDVKVVPVPAVNEAVDALVQGRAEVAVHALNSAKVREANASVGVRHVAADCSPQGVERRRKAVPFYRHTVIKAGQGAAVTEDTCLLTFDFYLVTHRAAPDAVVAAVLKAVWEQVDALGAFHPFLKQWTRERAVDPDVTVPYHPAAIPFYRERGAWSPKMDEAQQKLLALNP